MSKKLKGIGPDLPCDYRLGIHATRNYKSAWRHWHRYCVAKGISDFPAKPADFIDFLNFKAKTYKSGSVKMFAIVISATHKERGKQSPLQTLEAFRAMRAIMRSGQPPKQAYPINEHLRDAMIAACSTGTLRDLRDRAMIATAYDTFMRRGELISLNVDDIERSDTLPGGTAFIRFSKTDPTGVGRAAYLNPDTLDYIDAWRSAAGIVEGRLFRSIAHRFHCIRLSNSMGPQVVRLAFKLRARLAGAAPEIIANISCHSTRIGAAQDMSASGESDTAIMQAGGWYRKESVRRYIDKTSALRAGAARLAAKQGKSRKSNVSLSIVCNGEVDSKLMSQIVAALAPLAKVQSITASPPAELAD